MKKIKDFIIEKQNFLIKNKNILKNYNNIEYHPYSQQELFNIIIDLLRQGQTDLNCINTSEITDMGSLFYSINKIILIKDIDISEWDVSNVEFMDCMFMMCENFNSDLSNWDVSNVADMRAMFKECKNFNSDLSEWNVSKVNNMVSMFSHCKKFNSDLSKWNIKSKCNKSWIFAGCDTLKKNNKIPEWYTK